MDAFGCKDVDSAFFNMSMDRFLQKAKTMSDLAWSAGIFEGEGSIEISKPCKTNMGSLTTNVSNTDFEMLYELQRIFGGTVSRKNLKVGFNRKPARRWRLGANQAKAFLTAIRPFLRTSKYKIRADFAIAFQSQKLNTSRNLPEAYEEWQTFCYQRMKKLNKRGLK